MGNQASKVIEKTKEKKEKRKVRRRSTISVSTQSQASLQFTPASPTRANYDWLETSAPPSMSSSVTTSNAPTVSSTGSQQRRRSVSDFFAKRKQSLKTTISQDEYKENDRLQRLVSFCMNEMIDLSCLGHRYLNLLVIVALLAQECSQRKFFGTYSSSRGLHNLGPRLWRRNMEFGSGGSIPFCTCICR
jgi:hypothetical protein